MADFLTTFDITQTFNAAPVALGGANVHANAYGFELVVGSGLSTPDAGPVDIVIPANAVEQNMLYFISEPIPPITPLTVVDSQFTIPGFLNVITGHADVTITETVWATCGIDLGGWIDGFRDVIARSSTVDKSCATPGVLELEDVIQSSSISISTDPANTTRWVYYYTFSNAAATDSTIQIGGHSWLTYFTNSKWTRTGAVDNTVTSIIVPTGYLTDSTEPHVNASVTSSIVANGTSEVTGDTFVTGEAPLVATATVSPTGFISFTVLGAVAPTATSSLSITGRSYAVLVESSRFRNDDGDETTATWLSTINTDTTDITAGNNYRVRFAATNKSPFTHINNNQDSLEASTDGGPWQVISGIQSREDTGDAVFNELTDAYLGEFTTDTITGTYTAADQYELYGPGYFHIDSIGVWHLFYDGYIDYVYENPRLTGLFVVRSVDQGATWSTPIVIAGPKDAEVLAVGNNGANTSNTEMIIRESANGVLYLFWKHYAQLSILEYYTFILCAHSTTRGASWSSATTKDITRDGKIFFNSFNHVLRLSIIEDTVNSKFSPTLSVSTDYGVTWTGHLFNNGASPAHAQQCIFAHGEMNDDDSLSIWYVMHSADKALDGTTLGFVRVYKYIMTYPYTGWPVLVNYDDSAQLVFNNGAVFLNEIISSFAAFMFTAPTVEHPDRRYFCFATRQGIEYPAFRDGYCAYREDEAGVWAYIPDIELQNTDWAKKIVPAGISGGGTLYSTSAGRFAFPAQRLGTTYVDDTPMLYGWHDTVLYSHVSYSDYSGKIYAVDHSDADVLDKYTIREIKFGSLYDGANTTQQISGGDFLTENQGIIPFGLGTKNLTLAAGQTTEQEYRFQAKSGLSNGTKVCLRPSGWDETDPPALACFIIVGPEASITASAFISVAGFTDEPVILSATAAIAVVASLDKPGAALLPNTAIVATDARLDREGSVALNAYATVTSFGTLVSIGTSDITATANIAVSADVYKQGVVAMLAEAISSIGEPTIEVSANAVLQMRAFISVAAQRGVEAAVSMHSYASIAARDSTQKLCTSLTVYMDEQALTITQNSALTIADIPAKLTVNQSSAPDLILTQEAPLQVFLYE